MIIGNNNPFNKDNKFNKDSFENNNFKTKFKQYNENKRTESNIFTKDIKEQKYSNVNSKDEMYDKSLAMLNERLKQGLISIDEFNRKCNELARKRRK